MPSRTPEPPPHWENGWSPGSSRTPGTRRLWLAGALALATVAACVTAIAVDGGRTGTAASPAPSSPAAKDDGPGLLSFPSSPTATGSPQGGSRPGSGTPATDGSGSGKRPKGGKAGKGAGGESTSPTPASSPSRSGGASGSGGGPVAAWKSVRSVNYPDRSWHISRQLVRLDPVGQAGDPRTTVFKLVKGLANKACYSFATADGGYLRHRDFVLRSEHDDGSALFEKDATFCPRTSAYSGAVMLESVNYPGRYLRHRDFQLVLDPYQAGGQYRADSAFLLTDAPP